MKNKSKIIFAFFLPLFIWSCSTENAMTEITVTPTISQPISTTINYLALGDSYTIGESVCATCRYPEQLKKNLSRLYINTSFPLKIIAKTGWTTSNLLSAIKQENLLPNYDLITLLIGVNNQYQNWPFTLYEKEFPDLVNKAISLAKGDKSNVIVLSIPDYAYTPFGKLTQNGSVISAEIDRYNAFAEEHCTKNGVEFVNITDITRQGLINPALVAQDGLHPSENAYGLFVERLKPSVSLAIQN